MQSFTAVERQPDSRTTRLIEAAETTNSCVLPTDQGIQLWRYFETADYRRMRVAQEFMESVAIDLVEQKIAGFDAGKATRSILEDYLINPKLEKSDVVGMAGDLLLAGIDTVCGEGV